MGRPSALLLDIDGVLIHETSVESSEETEVLLLHRDINSWLAQLDASVFVITHRSRKEARQILQIADGGRGLEYPCFTANDIVASALTSRRLAALLRYGMRKSFILPHIRAQYGIEPADLCFLDDRPENVNDMLASGVGYGLVAPIRQESAGAITTFDFGEVVDRFRTWRERRNETRSEEPAVTILRPREQRVEGWCRTGMNTKRSARSVFNAGRRVVRSIRRVWERSP